MTKADDSVALSAVLMVELTVALLAESMVAWRAALLVELMADKKVELWGKRQECYLVDLRAA